MDPDLTAHQAAATSNHGECDDPDCACQNAADRPGDGAAEVTMTEVYDIDIPWGTTPAAGNTPRAGTSPATEMILQSAGSAGFCHPQLRRATTNAHESRRSRWNGDQHGPRPAARLQRR